MSKGRSLDADLSKSFLTILKRKISYQFAESIILNKKIHYSEFRKFCGRSFGFQASETERILDILRDYQIVNLSSSGFIIRNKTFFTGCNKNGCE